MALGDVYSVPTRAVPSTTGKTRICLVGKVVFTTSGAVDTTNSVTPQVTPSKTGTGAYRLTIPKCANVVAVVTYHNANGSSIVSATGGAISETNGTVDFLTHTNTASDVADNAASGDYLSYIIWGDA
jgi:hypothetical protein